MMLTMITMVFNYNSFASFANASNFALSAPHISVTMTPLLYN